MPTYVIEREFPDAGRLTATQLRDISLKSCNVLAKMGPGIDWVQSYVTDDKIYCVYIAHSEAMVREHAALGGFPADKVSAVREIIDPSTAKAVA
jgi:Nickel responsive protein SCO4226-like